MHEALQVLERLETAGLWLPVKLWRFTSHSDATGGDASGIWQAERSRKTMDPFTKSFLLLFMLLNPFLLIIYLVDLVQEMEFLDFSR